MKTFLNVAPGFMFMVPCIVNYVTDKQGDAALNSLYFILLPSYSTCFGCLPHPSSGVPKL
jgi:hypothetical protein